ncbi:hypothetical protein [Paraburkholderia sp. BCC1885]|uniref:hypothetical protein n=1 Tax=Paraburkholderia sp. BCC1885 TaxID=2562669 RepID=UPI001182D125|nr:hypothetical protein [Paraburkholderia sp. BCC1885]
MKIVPAKPLVISYEKNACLLTAAFSPKKDAHYWLIATEGRKPLDPDASFLSSLMHVRDRECDVGVAELDNEGHPLTPVRLTQLKPRQTGLTCIRFQ